MNEQIKKELTFLKKLTQNIKEKLENDKGNFPRANIEIENMENHLKDYDVIQHFDPDIKLVKTDQPKQILKEAPQENEIPTEILLDQLRQNQEKKQQIEEEKQQNIENTSPITVTDPENIVANDTKKIPAEQEYKGIIEVSQPTADTAEERPLTMQERMAIYGGGKQKDKAVENKPLPNKLKTTIFGPKLGESNTPTKQSETPNLPKKESKALYAIRNMKPNTNLKQDEQPKKESRWGVPGQSKLPVNTTNPQHRKDPSEVASEFNHSNSSSGNIEIKYTDAPALNVKQRAAFLNNKGGR